MLNTVALQIRERAHDIGVFKAIGMTPRQTLAMIVCSVAATGLVAGIVAVPAGVYLHHGVVPVMAHAANSGYPPSLISVYAPWETHPACPGGPGHRRRRRARPGRLGGPDPHRLRPPRRVTARWLCN